MTGSQGKQLVSADITDTALKHGQSQHAEVLREALIIPLQHAHDGDFCNVTEKRMCPDCADASTFALEDLSQNLSITENWFKERHTHTHAK